MHRRILFGVAAWLLGAATATAGSLLAISLLGQGITGSPDQLLTQDAVNRALVSEAAEASPPDAATAATGKPPAAASPSAPAAPSPPAATAPASAAASAGGTVLTSAGGEVVAGCQAGDAYLISWSPSQGYEVDGVDRGPATIARVAFDSGSSRVTMAVSCSTGAPTATTHAGEGDN